MTTSKDKDGRGKSVAVVCTTTRCGGASRSVINLCNAWSEEGRQVTLIPLKNHELFFELSPRVKYVRPDVDESPRAKSRKHKSRELARAVAWMRGHMPAYLSNKLSFWESWLWARTQPAGLRALLHRLDARAVVSFGSYANILTLMASRGLNRQVVISERNDVAQRPLVYPWEPLRIGLYNTAHRVTANNLSALNAMRAYVDDEKLVFTPNFVRAPTAQALNPGAGAPSRILIVAKLRKIKAHDVLLVAFSKLVHKLSRWRLSIVGTGEQENYLGELARSLEISDRVDWHGEVSDPDPHYRDARIFVLPSHSEGMSNAVLEAMSHGLPIIVSDTPGLRGLIQNEITGLIVPAGDSDALSNAIARLAADPDLSERLGRAAKNAVESFEPSKVLSVWNRLVDQ